MYFDMKRHETHLYRKDIEKLEKIKKYLVGKVKLPKLGSYLSLNDEELWIKIVIQFCVMGGTRMIDSLMNDKTKSNEFKKKIGLNKLLLVKNNRQIYIDRVLKEYKATRFHNTQAKKIDNILKNLNVVKKGRIVLLDGLSYTQDFKIVRDKLMYRNPYFKLKSVSDFMIEVGLSHDVIAFDTRVVNILKKHFGLNVGVDKVQGNKAIYESIESALRRACGTISISLAQLDRILFRFSNKNAITFILEDF